MEARKTKVVALQAGEEVHRGATSAAEAEAVGLSADSVAKPAPAAAAPTKTAQRPKPAKAGTVGGGSGAGCGSSEPAAAPAEGGGKAALDNDFLNGLMDDPLGKSKERRRRLRAARGINSQ